MASNDSHRKRRSPFSDQTTSRSIRSKVACHRLGNNDENLEPNESTALLSNMESGLNTRGHPPTSKHSGTIVDSSMSDMHDNMQALVPVGSHNLGGHQEIQHDVVSADQRKPHHDCNKLQQRVSPRRSPSYSHSTGTPQSQSS